MWRENPHLFGNVSCFTGHQLDTVAFGQAAIDHPHQHHHTDISVVPAVNNHGPQSAFRIATRRWNTRHHGFENFVNAHAGFGAAGNRIGGINANDFLNFLPGVVGVGLGQVHFIEHRNHFHAQIKRGIAVGNGLRFNTLAGIDHQ